ncbi:MAG TPA: hypothetical protein VK086_06650 [Ruania sp.]|nr:hypothetical protein [Ruania sp.]
MSQDDRPHHPLPLRVGLVVALLEAAGLIVMGIAGVLSSLVDDGAMLGTNAGVLIVFALIGGFLLIMVRELWRGKRRGRGPVITWQILQFAVAASSFGAVAWWLLAVAMLLSVVVTACLLLPASLTATGTGGKPDGVL